MKKIPFTRVEILKRQITSFYKTEEKMLKNVKNKNLINMDLVPFPDEISAFYKENGLREDRADMIAQNYATKYIMLEEFLQGKKISVYAEKHKKTEN